MQDLGKLIKMETQGGTKSIIVYLDKDGNEVTDPNNAVQARSAIYDKYGNIISENYFRVNKKRFNKER